QNATWHFWYETAGSQHGVAQVPSGTMHSYQPDHDSGAVGRSMSVSEFVQTRFIPEYVVTRGSAGHAHFKAILRYVLTPEQFRCAFPAKLTNAGRRLREMPGWPYLGLLPLCEVSADMI